jgi:hypothetical protein
MAMTRRWLAVAVLGAAALVLVRQHTTTEAAMAAEPMIGHMVYFSLKDNSDAAKQKLVAACKQYLAKHEGTVFFAAGVVGQEFNREVNDRDWDVGLHLVFQNKAAHDKYQDHPLHKKFIEENRDNWKKVRVFDSLVER